ncbi:glycosyl transferase [Peptostreptococcus equinus]|uniref:Glycosyl transferase n=1 Tax=Peptostreptococcus equinus TaxID=3003601 RepID=A0ABY7JQJ8_9FIRM|nr:glycosyl transferase [Peptostreptococcus sp. CBA3647]WAW15627.1 glycosyl transferase [Peptostreptococcus sp. CBA3647]
MSNNILALALFIFGIIVSSLSIYLVKNMLIDSGLIRPNYKRINIPVGMGLCFIPNIIINGAILAFLSPTKPQILLAFILISAMITMCLTGLLDDCLGNRDISGLKGHFISLFKGKLTTGGFKALTGGFVGILVSVALTKSIPEILLGAVLVALSTNLMNLLDLRPGRAIKVFLFISLLLLIFNSGFNRALSMILIPAVVAYFYFDLRALAMMGDTGSNVLGVFLGVLILISYDFKIQLMYLIILVALHILTEKYSLTKIIESNKFLNFIDKLGRN